MIKVYEFLKNCGCYYLATVECDQPRVRPFGTVDVFENRLYIQTGKSKAVANQLKNNPKIELCSMSADGRWIRVTAEAVLDENIEAQQHMLDAYPELKAMYSAGDGNTEVYYLKNAVATITSFTSDAVVIKF